MLQPETLSILFNNVKDYPTGSSTSLMKDFLLQIDCHFPSLTRNKVGGAQSLGEEGEGEG